MHAINLAIAIDDVPPPAPADPGAPPPDERRRALGFLQSHILPDLRFAVAAASAGGEALLIVAALEFVTVGTVEPRTFWSLEPLEAGKYGSA